MREQRTEWQSTSAQEQKSEDRGQGTGDRGLVARGSWLVARGSLLVAHFLQPPATSHQSPIYPLFAICYLLFAIPCLYGRIPPSVVDGKIEFVFIHRTAKSVSIAGEFNNWTPERDFLKYHAERDLWFIRLKLPVGRYEYKYLIDGKWLEGANLTVEIKEKDGVLFIPKPRVPPPNTPFSGKIHFNGKIMGIAGYDINDSSISGENFHADFDWHISASKDITAFARIEYDYSREPQRLLFKQGHLNIEPEPLKDIEFNAKAFYKTKSIQFNNPLKMTDRYVGLKYEVVEFYDETSPQKAFGLWEQGIVTQLRFFGGDLTAFYADMLRPATYFNTLEDNFGVRYFYKIKNLPFGFGATYLGTRGGWWPYANMDNNWFPDPEKFGGYSSSGPIRNIAQPWYRGYLNNDFTGFDARFYFLPWMEFFAESTSRKTVLKTERISGDIPFEKTWVLEKNNILLYGTKIKLSENFAVELSQKNESISFKSPLSPTDIATDRKTFNTVARYDDKKFTVGISYKNADSGKISGGMPLDIHPFRRQILYDGLFPYSATTLGHLLHIVGSETFYMPFISYRSEKFDITLKSKLLSFMVLPESRDTLSGVRLSAEGDTRRLSLTQNVGTLSTKIIDNLYLENSVRYLTWETPDMSKFYLTDFHALKYKFTDNFSVKFGYGFDPEDFDDDILADFDRREVFLYNESIKYGDVLSAEEKLSKLNRVTIRTVFRF